MKVTKKEELFSPITIVLETAEEAEVMFLALNYHVRAIDGGQANDGTSVPEARRLVDVGHTMWATFCAVYRRRKK